MGYPTTILAMQQLFSTTPVLPCWQSALNEELAAPYMVQLQNSIDQERAKGVLVYPENDQVLRALDFVPLDQVRVVIIGQDPYHGPGQAEGLSFSVPRGIKIPPSLRNIYTELQSDLGIAPPSHGSLVSWAKQGVLLLNTTLTVRDGVAGAHSGLGWERLTDRILASVVERDLPTAYLLWGRSAKTKVEHVLRKKKGCSLVLTAPHPSPLSAYRGFLGCRHFSQTNTYLQSHSLPTIDWMPK